MTSLVRHDTRRAGGRDPPDQRGGERATIPRPRSRRRGEGPTGEAGPARGRGRPFLRASTGLFAYFVACATRTTLFPLCPRCRCEQAPVAPERTGAANASDIRHVLAAHGRWCLRMSLAFAQRVSIRRLPPSLQPNCLRVVSAPRAALVQMPALPCRSIAVRFALNKQTPTERLQCDAS